MICPGGFFNCDVDFSESSNSDKPESKCWHFVQEIIVKCLFEKTIGCTAAKENYALNFASQYLFTP